MTQIERELEEHLRRLSPASVVGPPGADARPYIGAALDDWGYTVDRPAPQGAGPADAVAWSVVGRLGLGLPGRVRLCARLDPGAAVADASAAGVAVLLALAQLLAQHRLRHSLEVVVWGGPPDQRAYGEGPELPVAALWGALVARVSFTGPRPAGAQNSVGACCIAPALAADVRRLLDRYPQVIWAEPERASLACAPGLWVGVAPVAAGDPDALHLREAVMLGAEIVALLQSWSPHALKPAPA